MGNIFSFVNSFFNVLAWAAFFISLAYIFILGKGAKERGVQKEVMLYLPLVSFGVAILTVLKDGGASTPHIFYPLIPVTLCVVLCYPLLYRGLPGKRLMPILLKANVIGLVFAAAYAILAIFGYRGGMFTRVIDIVLTLAVAGGCIPLLMVLYHKGLAHKYCYHCGRYSAKHEHTRDLVKVLGVSPPSENYIFDHETKRTNRDGQQTITRYYRTIQTEASEFGIITPFYRCDHCGEEFESMSEDFG